MRFRFNKYCQDANIKFIIVIYLYCHCSVVMNLFYFHCVQATYLVLKFNFFVNIHSHMCFVPEALVSVIC